MKPDHILVRFGELTTKGKNRKLFIRKLLKNTKEILHDYSALEYELTYDRLYIYLNEENAEEVTDKLKTIFGIHNFSLCYKVEHDLEKAKEVVTYIIDHDEGHTFKIDTKRHDKSYPKTSIEMNKVAEPFIQRRAIRHLEKGRVVIFGGGTGSPYFSTDTTAALRASEIKADAILMAKNGVDGVYNADPKKDPTATRFEHLTYMDLLNKGLQVMDSTATSMCMDNDMELVVFNMNEKGNIVKAMKGEAVCTRINKEEK